MKFFVINIYHLMNIYTQPLHLEQEMTQGPFEAGFLFPRFTKAKEASLPYDLLQTWRRTDGFMALVSTKSGIWTWVTDSISYNHVVVFR